MARRSKAQIEKDNTLKTVNQNACFGLSIPMLKLSEISKASEAAYDNGIRGDELAAVARKKAQELHDAA